MTEDEKFLRLMECEQPVHGGMHELCVKDIHRLCRIIRTYEKMLADAPTTEFDFDPLTNRVDGINRIAKLVDIQVAPAAPEYGHTGEEA